MLCVIKPKKARTELKVNLSNIGSCSLIHNSAFNLKFSLINDIRRQWAPKNTHTKSSRCFCFQSSGRIFFQFAVTKQAGRHGIQKRAHSPVVAFICLVCHNRMGWVFFYHPFTLTVAIRSLSLTLWHIWKLYSLSCCHTTHHW